MKLITLLKLSFCAQSSSSSIPGINKMNLNEIQQFNDQYYDSIPFKSQKMIHYNTYDKSLQHACQNEKYSHSHQHNYYSTIDLQEKTFSRINNEYFMNNYEYNSKIHASPSLPSNSQDLNYDIFNSQISSRFQPAENNSDNFYNKSSLIVEKKKAENINKSHENIDLSISIFDITSESIKKYRNSTNNCLPSQERVANNFPKESFIFNDKYEQKDNMSTIANQNNDITTSVNIFQNIACIKHKKIASYNSKIQSKNDKNQANLKKPLTVAVNDFKAEDTIEIYDIKRKETNYFNYNDNKILNNTCNYITQDKKFIMDQTKQRKYYQKNNAKKIIIKNKVNVKKKVSQRFNPEYKRLVDEKNFSDFKFTKFNELKINGNLVRWGLVKNLLQKKLSSLFPKNYEEKFPDILRSHNPEKSIFFDKHVSDFAKDVNYLYEIAKNLDMPCLKEYININQKEIADIMKKIQEHLLLGDLTIESFVEINKILSNKKVKSFRLKKSQIAILIECLTKDTHNKFWYLLPEINFIHGHVESFKEETLGQKEYKFNNKSFVSYLTAIYAISVIKSVDWKSYVEILQTKKWCTQEKILFYNKSRLNSQYFLSYLLIPFLEEAQSKIFLGKIIIEEFMMKNAMLKYTISKIFDDKITLINNMSIIYTFYIFMGNKQSFSYEKMPRQFKKMFKAIFIHADGIKILSSYFSNKFSIDAYLKSFNIFFESIKLNIPEDLRKKYDLWLGAYNDRHKTEKKCGKNMHFFAQGNPHKPAIGIKDGIRLYKETLHYIYFEKMK